MTDTPVLDPAGVGSRSRPDDVRALSDQLSRLMRVVHALKALYNSSASGDAARERAAHTLLFPLVRLGPQRQSALAEIMHTDPSTVSRHVALLVDRGLVRRVADASDGRASQLVVTDTGREVTAALCDERESLFQRVTDDWSPDDLAAFTTHLHRFVDGLTAVLPELSSAATDNTHLRTPEKDR